MKHVISEDLLLQSRSQIEEIARTHGISEAEVRSDMMAAIRAGMENPDPAVQKKWAEIPWKGNTPTVEEFIAWMTLEAEAETTRESAMDS